MLQSSALKDLLHIRGLTRGEQILLCLAVDGATPRSVSDIKRLAQNAGLRRVKDWNVSDMLSRLNGQAIRTEQGWELTGAGRNAAAALLSKHSVAPTVAPANAIRALLARIASPSARDFIVEAVACLEFGQLRAAVVFSWVGAVSLLHERVLTRHLAMFNAEVKRRDAKWKDASSVDDLAKMKEFDFLQVLEAISVIGRNAKLELEGCLKLRNACGHPSSLSIASHRVASHLEILLLNVYVAFAA